MSQTPSSSTHTQAPEVITVPADAESVSCDGGHPSLGHPIVYYHFDGQDRLTCGYCDREFVKASS